MNYTDFLSYIKNKLSEDLSQTDVLHITPVTRNNNIVLDGLCIFRENSHVSPNIYLNPYYQRYLNGETKEDLLSEIKEIFFQHAECPKYLDYQIASDFSKHKSQITYRLVNYQKNTKLLKEIPHIRFLDLAIIFYCLVGQTDDGIASLRITNQMIEEWNIKSRELYLAAVENMPRLFPACIRPIQELLYEMIEKTPVPGLSLSEGFSACPSTEDISSSMYVMTSKNGINGAGTLLYPMVLQEFASSIQSDLYVLPSSIHEVILVPVTASSSSSQEDLSVMVQEINQSHVAAEEILSDHAYLFHWKTNAFDPVA